MIKVHACMSSHGPKFLLFGIVLSVLLCLEARAWIAPNGCVDRGSIRSRTLPYPICSKRRGQSLYKTLRRGNHFRSSGPFECKCEVSSGASKQRVVITGVGAVSAIGIGADAFFSAVAAGHCGVRPLPAWADGFPCSVAAQVGGFRPEDWYTNKKEVKRQSRYMHFCVAGAKLALADAGLDPGAMAPAAADRFGVLLGTTLGGTEVYEDAAEKWAAHSVYPSDVQLTRCGRLDQRDHACQRGLAAAGLAHYR